MLAGRRLFLGETDYQTVKLVQQSNVPSLSRINPEVDAELERVIGKALEKDPTKRFQNARDFGDALAQYLFSRQQKVTSFDVANLVKWVVDSKKAAKSGQKADVSIIDRLIQEELLRFTSLDDVAATVAPGSDSDPKDGAAPLDAGLFENPADWFADDNDVQSAVDAKAREQNRGPRWAETGVEDTNLSDMLEDRASHEAEAPRVSQPRVSEPSKPAKPAPAAERVSVPPEPPPPAEPAKPLKTTDADAKDRPAEAPKSNALLYVAIAIVVIAGAGAAAYFGGFLG
jgi:serine/threonine protein kinase